MKNMELFNNNLDLVDIIIHKNLQYIFDNSSVLKDIDFYRQTMLMELLRCSEKYEDGHGAKFQTYASKCMQLKLQEHIYKNKKNCFKENNEIRLNRTIDTDIEELGSIIPDRVNTVNEFIEQHDLSVSYTNFKNSLDERESRIIELLEKYTTHTDIAKEFGVNRITISRYVKQLKNKFKTFL